MYKVEVVESDMQASNLVTTLENEGFRKEDVYIFAHDKKRSNDLTDATATGTVGMEEQGLLDSVANLFKDHGDQLRAKMRSLGLTDMEAEQYEQALDEGRLVVIAAMKEDDSNGPNLI